MRRCDRVCLNCDQPLLWGAGWCSYCWRVGIMLAAALEGGAALIRNARTILELLR